MNHHIVSSALIALFLTLTPITNAASTAPSFNPQLPIPTRVQDLLSRMTIEEKIAQLHQGHTQPLNSTFNDTYYQTQLQKGLGSIIWTLEDSHLRNHLQQLALNQSRLKIPLVFAMDVIHGYRTVFPISLGLSCAWNPTLFQHAQTIAAREARAAGIDWVFAPMSDVARDPRWGRVAETCGEDPYLASLDITAQVKGLQGDLPNDQSTIAPNHVAACLKHFVGYSAVIGGRDYNAADVGEFVLRNTHLPPYRAGVQAGALTIMSSFNTIDGTPSVANHHTLTDILRNQWHFTGLVVSDWEAVAEQIDWSYAKDNAAAAISAINAGNDMEMISNTYATLPDALKSDEVAMSTIDRAVTNVLTLKFRLGLFEHPYIDADAYPKSILQPNDLKLAREAAAQSAVLLKNDNAIPLPQSATHIALIGPFADDAHEMLGCWPGKGHPQDVITLAKGIRAALPSNATLQLTKGCDILDTHPSTQPATFTDAIESARHADIVILTLGEPASWTGENTSRAALTVTGHQQQLFDAIAAATNKPIITIIFSGRPLSLPAILQKSAAVIYAWQPGIQAGNGLADILFGAAPPTARLTMSIPADIGQVPIYYNHDTTGRPTSGKYRDLTTAPMFPFGFGLATSTLAYSKPNLQLATANHPAIATTTITNTGQKEADDTPQLYIHQVACQEAVRPAQELRAFQHIHLAPRQSTTVSFPLTDQTLGYYHRDGTFVTDNGDYQIWIAPHAETTESTLYHRGQ